LDTGILDIGTPDTEYPISIDSKNRRLRTIQYPKIEFIKINPTKYRVKVEGATGPYTLIFSESFHKGWKIYEGDTGILDTEYWGTEYPISNIQYLVSKLGSFASRITDIFLDDGDCSEEIASYFNGEIKEGTHRNTFLEPATFETWGKKPIEAEHLTVNGYANSWYIEPEDVDGAENYELIVEFWPQRLFYIGLFVSLMTLLGCVGYLGVKKILDTKYQVLRY